MSDAQVSINELLANAEEADRRGVPVDWKNIAYRVYTVATNYIADLERVMEKEKNETD